jgi:hypothetical protein
MSAVFGRGQMLSLDTLVRVRRGLSLPKAPRRLTVPDGMQDPLGCDAVAVPAGLGPLIMPHLPRVGCVYTDDTHWWWLVPSDSDYALDWPAPAHYAIGAIFPDSRHAPVLSHRSDGTLPYTPPIPLYLALCRLTGATPTWAMSSAG